MLYVNGREVVTMQDNPDRALMVAVTDPCLGLGHWSDATTPRTDKPVRFRKGEHRVYRGGSIVRLARMGTPSRIA
jgi:hypothetical protein